MNALEERITAFIHYGEVEAMKVIAELGVTGEHFTDSACRAYFELAHETLKTRRFLFVSYLREVIFEKGHMSPEDYVRVTRENPGMISCELRPLCYELKRLNQQRITQLNALKFSEAVNSKDDETAQKALAQLKAADLSADPRPPLTWQQSITVEAQKVDAIIAKEEPEEIRTIEWPWPSLGERHGNFRRGELCIVAGSPSLGKSSLMRQFLHHAATRDLNTLMISLEVPQGDIANLMAAAVCGHSWAKLKDLHPRDQKEFHLALRGLRALPITVIDNLTSLDPILSASQRVHETGFLDAIAIDYLGLIRDCEQSRFGTKASNTGMVTAAFKRLATELGCVVFLGVQLNRDQMRDGNREPKLIDLKDSGDIEAHADRVLMLHRPDQDPITKMTQKPHEDVSEQPRFFQDIFQEKGRNVGTTFSSVYFRRECARFELGARPINR